MSEWSHTDSEHQDYPIQLLEGTAQESETTAKNMRAGGSEYADYHDARARGLRAAASLLTLARGSVRTGEGDAAKTDPPSATSAGGSAQASPGETKAEAPPTMPPPPRGAPAVEVKALPAKAGEGNQALVADAAVLDSRPVGANGKTSFKNGDFVHNKRTGTMGVVTGLFKSRAHFPDPDMFWMGNKGPFKIADFVRPSDD